MSRREIDVPVRRLRANARLPERMSTGAAGFDLSASEGACLEPGRFCIVPTGIAVAIPEGYEAQVRARSGLAATHGVGVLNGPGTIDSDYRGEIRVILFNFGERVLEIAPGDRIAQIVVQAVAPVRWVASESLEQTHRGDAGFGHTGRASPT